MICPGCGKRVPDDGFALCAECDAERGIRHERHTEETIADIVAQMRNGTIPKHRTDHELLALYADRIEAAAKREELRWAKENGELARMIDLQKVQVGNAAATREALVAVKKSIDGIGASSLDCDPTILMSSLTLICGRLSSRIERALSAPLRNFDVGTAEEQVKRFEEFCEDSQVDEDYTPMCARCTLRREKHCELAWARMPYESEVSDGK